MLSRTMFRAAALAALPLLAAACGDDPASPSGDGQSVATLVASVSTASTSGTLETSAIPRPSSGGPAIEVSGHLTVVNGGSASLIVSSDTPFSTLIVSGSSPASRLFVPVSGFYQVTLPAPVTDTELTITFPTDLPGGDFDLFFSGADEEGHVGSLVSRSFHALTVGTGDVQVTANWDTDADVDLHVVDPAGYEIYWADRDSPTGGSLDLDSNAACAGDNVRNENIVWGVGEAPSGTYTVRLDYWTNCSASATNYTVLVNNGGDVEIFHGTFTGGGDLGGLGSGRLITTFVRASGPVAAPAANSTTAAATTGRTAKTRGL